jgi:hypothetical protein
MATMKTKELLALPTRRFIMNNSRNYHPGKQYHHQHQQRYLFQMTLTIPNVVDDVNVHHSQRFLHSTPTRLLSQMKNNNSNNSTATPISSLFVSASTTTTRGGRSKRKRKFVPRKSAVQLTDTARNLFIKLLQSKPDKHGIMLDYHQSSTGEPRMVFSFRFINNITDELSDRDECVPLQLRDDGTPKSPQDALSDDEPKLYIHHNAFMKVLGATVDVDMETITPILYDKEGNKMDPNA